MGRRERTIFDPSISDKALIHLCEAQDVAVLSSSGLGARVVRVTEDAVVKFGIGVTSDEASNMSFVYDHADPLILRVPKVLRYFQDCSDPKCCYLVMEYIEGTVLEQLDVDKRSKLSSGIARALRHLWDMPVPPDHAPGPLGEGPPKGYAWSDNGASTPFLTICQMELFINDCLFDHCFRHSGPLQIPQIHLHDAKVVMCHTDLASRNIISLSDGSICFLDWAYGGLYPRMFEIYSLAARVAWEPEYFAAILQEFDITDPWSDQDINMLDVLNKALTKGIL